MESHPWYGVHRWYGIDGVGSMMSDRGLFSDRVDYLFGVGCFESLSFVSFASDTSDHVFTVDWLKKDGITLFDYPALANKLDDVKQLKKYSWLVDVQRKRIPVVKTRLDYKLAEYGLCKLQNDLIDFMK